MVESYALDTAARFGEIPFVEFTQELVTGVFDCLVQAHADQMETYAIFLNSLTQNLSSYINNTVDNVSFSDISEFVLNYQLPTITDNELQTALNLIDPNSSSNTQADTGNTWWKGLLNALAPAVKDLVGKIPDSNIVTPLTTVGNNSTTAIPTYKDIQQSIAALIASNKYSLLQNMAKLGLLRLVVTGGQIETRITFSTWNNSSSGSETSDKQKVVNKVKSLKGGGLIGIFRKKNKEKSRILTVNTAKSYQRDSSGSRVDIFGRVLIEFKTDYAPLNG